MDTVVDSKAVIPSVLSMDKEDEKGDVEDDEGCFIEFRWRAGVRVKAQCDGVHLLFLVQRACEFYGDALNERNKYFDSISRRDRVREHVDTRRFITNLIEWLNEDKESNVFNGEIFENESALFMVNLMAKMGAFSLCDYSKTDGAVCKHSELSLIVILLLMICVVI
jgi:hypothetical protein